VPEISSVFVLPAAPAAPNAASPAVAGTPAAPDRRPGDFLSQFKAAIKNLATAALPQVATPVVSALVAQTDATVAATDVPPLDTKNTDAKQSELMPEILAALGFVVVPPVLQAPVVAAQATDTASPHAAVTDTTSPPVVAQSSQPFLHAAPSLPQPAQPLQMPRSPQSLPALETSLEVLSAAPEVQSASPTLQSVPPQPASLQVVQSLQAPATPLLDQLQAISAQPLSDTQQQQLTAVVQATLPERRAPKTDVAAATPAVISQVDPVAASSVTIAPQAAVAVDAPAPQHRVTAPIADSTTPIVAAQPAGSFQQSSFGTSSRQRQSTPVVESATAPTAADAAPDATFAAAASLAPHNTAALPADIQPAQVVNQIAHQADLYRVPGDRSVRIQLHPEGLGGVDVTLRYSVASGIQLHLNVEHAATSALVQAGWTDLRDALATQGIRADRLVMSISAPANASGLDFSNGNGSHRSDSGLASFTQGQSSQQRQETQDQHTARGWNGAIDPILPPSNDTIPRVAPAGAGHIDYRV